jgi:hypothetical protein
MANLSNIYGLSLERKIEILKEYGYNHSPLVSNFQGSPTYTYHDPKDDANHFQLAKVRSVISEEDLKTFETELSFRDYIQKKINKW